jgi:hypothetical protein
MGEKRERQQVTFGRRIGEGVSGKSTRHFLCFLFSFVELHLLLPRCPSLLPFSERRNGNFSYGRRLTGFLSSRRAGMPSRMNRIYSLFHIESNTYLLCKACREGVGVQRPTFSPIYPPLYDSPNHLFFGLLTSLA